MGGVYGRYERISSSFTFTDQGCRADVPHSFAGVMAGGLIKCQLACEHRSYLVQVITVRKATLPLAHRGASLVINQSPRLQLIICFLTCKAASIGLYVAVLAEVAACPSRTSDAGEIERKICSKTGFQ